MDYNGHQDLWLTANDSNSGLELDAQLLDFFKEANGTYEIKNESVSFGGDGQGQIPKASEQNWAYTPTVVYKSVHNPEIMSSVSDFMNRLKALRGGGHNSSYYNATAGYYSEDSIGILERLGVVMDLADQFFHGVGEKWQRVCYSSEPQPEMREKIEQHITKHSLNLLSIMDRFFSVLENVILTPSEARKITSIELRLYRQVADTVLLHREFYCSMASAVLLFCKGKKPLIALEKDKTCKGRTSAKIFEKDKDKDDAESRIISGLTLEIRSSPNTSVDITTSPMIRILASCRKDVQAVEQIQEDCKGKRKSAPQRFKYETQSNKRIKLLEEGPPEYFTEDPKRHILACRPKIRLVNKTRKSIARITARTTIRLITGSTDRATGLTTFRTSESIDLETEYSWPYEYLSNVSQYSDAFHELFHSEVFASLPLSMGGLPTDSVPWPKYANYLQSYFINTPKNSKRFKLRAITLVEFSQIHGMINGGKYYITLAEANKFFEWFSTVLHCLCNHGNYPLMWNNGYLFPFMSDSSAELVLMNKEIGTTILRFSSDKEYCKNNKPHLFVSWVKGTGSGAQILHNYINRDEITQQRIPAYFVEKKSELTFFARRVMADIETKKWGDKDFSRHRAVVLDHQFGSSLFEQIELVDRQTFLNDNPFKRANEDARFQYEPLL